MELKAPYLLFLGDTQDPFATKLARGVVDWRPELALAENHLANGTITTGIPEMSIPEAVDAGAKSFVLGLANSGGEARRLIKGGGVSVNGSKIMDPEQRFNADDFKSTLEIKTGKKHFHRFSLS